MTMERAARRVLATRAVWLAVALASVTTAATAAGDALVLQAEQRFEQRRYYLQVRALPGAVAEEIDGVIRVTTSP